MHEKQRFAIALGGIGACLCIAAGILVSRPMEMTVVALPGAPAAPRQARPLPGLPVPEWADAASAPAAPAARARARASVVAVRAEKPPTASVLAPAPIPASAAAELSRQSSIVTRPFALPVMLSPAPNATGSEVVDAGQATRAHGAVAGAFVTAGVHLGDGFKTVGRTLRRVF